MGQRTQLPVAVERAPDVPHSGGPKRRVPGTAACCGPVGRAPRHRGAHDEATTPHVLALDVELDQLRAAVVWLKTENERLLRLLRLSPQEAAAPGPAQSGMIDHRPPGARAVRPGDQGRVLPSHLRLPSGRLCHALDDCQHRPGGVGAGGSWWLPEGQRSVQAPVPALDQQDRRSPPERRARRRLTPAQGQQPLPLGRRGLRRPGSQVVTDMHAALEAGRHCLVLTQWTRHVEVLAEALRGPGHDPVVLRGGLGVKARAAALDRLRAPGRRTAAARGGHRLLPR